MTYEELQRLYYENGGQFLPMQETGEWGGMSGGYFQPVTLPDGRTIIPSEGGFQVTQMDGSERNYGELVMPDGTSRPLDYTGEERSFGSRLGSVAAPVLGIMGAAAGLGALTGTLGGAGAAAAPVAGATAPAAAGAASTAGGVTMGGVGAGEFALGGGTALSGIGGAAAGTGAAAGAGAGAGMSTLGGVGSWLGQNANWLLPAAGAIAGAADDGQESRTSGLPDWMQPYAQQYLQNSQNLSQTPFTPYGGQGVAPVNADQQAAINNARSLAMGGDPNVNAARQQQMSVVRGDMLNSNPYIDRVAQGITDRMGEAYATGTRGNLTSAFNRAGADPRYSSAYGQTVGNSDRAFTDSVGQTMAGLYGDNYRQERNAQDLASRFTPNFAADSRTNTEGLFNAGLLQQQTDQSQNNFDFGQFQAQQQYPFQMNNVLGNAINPQFGQTTTADDGVPWWMRAAGGAAAGVAASRSLYPSAQTQAGQSAPFPAYFDQSYRT